MIAWNAIFQYILKPTVNLKIIALAVIALGLCIRKRPFALQLYQAGQKLPVWPFLLVILLLAFSSRLFWVLWSPHIPPASIVEDSLIQEHARNLAAGRGYVTEEGTPTALRPIGYPLFVAFFYKIFGESAGLLEWVHVILGTLAVFLIYFLGKQIHSQAVGLLAALLFSLNPTAIMSTKLLMDEHLFIPLWLLSLVFLVSEYKRPALWKLILAGMVLGISAEVRTYSIVTLGSAFLSILIGKKSLRMALGRTAVLTALVMLCALPWTVRNQVKLGHPVPYTTLLGIHLYYANNPTSDVRYGVNPDREHGGDPEFLNSTSEVERDRTGRKAAWNWIRQNPGTFVSKAVGRLAYMLGLNGEGWVVRDNFTTIKPGAVWPSKLVLKSLEKWDQYNYVLLFWFTIVGLGLWTGKTRDMIWIVSTLGFYLLVTMIALNHRKYRFSIDAFFCLMAAYTFFQIFLGHAAQNAKTKPTK